MSNFIIFKRYIFYNSKSAIIVVKIIDGILSYNISFLLRILVNQSFIDNVLSKKAIIIKLFRNSSSSKIQ